MSSRRGMIAYVRRPRPSADLARAVSEKKGSLTAPRFASRCTAAPGRRLPALLGRLAALLPGPPGAAGGGALLAGRGLRGLGLLFLLRLAPRGGGPLAGAGFRLAGPGIAGRLFL